MLRRKKRMQPRPPREAQPNAPRSRRRARPDIPVPESLRLDEHAERELRGPPRQKAPSPAPAPVATRPPQERQRMPRGGDRPAKPRAAPQKVVLVTGFEPFGGETVNPSWQICSQLPRSIAGHRIETCRVPCGFRTAIEVVAEAIQRHEPGIVLSLGQAGGRSQMGVERIAINIDDARAPDNAGQQPVDEVIAANGPPAYFSTLPVKAMVAAMRRAGVPAELSNTAGTYVCNHLMYGVLHFLAASGTAARAGFIHVPYAEEQVLDKRGVAGMAVATMARGVEAAIAAAVEHRADVKTTEGTLD